MWTDEQLNAAKYVSYSDYENKQELGVGTIEILTGANQGVYFMRPAPPFGSLGNENNSCEGIKFGATVPAANFSVGYMPRGLPVPDRAPADQYVIHDYGKPQL